MKILRYNSKRTPNEFNKQYKPIVFVNNPVNHKEDDIIGFESQVETLACSIDSGANIIGLVADYGSGKSSLTDILSEVLQKRKKIIKPIKINLWDCLKKDSKNEEKVSLLTRSFLYQLSSGHGYKFGSFINKILSKNYGNISFGVNTRRFWWMFVLSGILFVLYKISTLTNTGIMKFLPETYSILASAFRLASPVFLFLTFLFLILGIKDTYIAFSHWKMQEKRELEINDVYDTYSTIIKKIIPFRKNRKRLIIIEDLDRVSDREIVIDFLKELYRFHDSLGEYSNRFVFLVSIKPEALLKPNNTDENIYAKIFDTIISLKPIHFDDYDSVLLKLIDNNPIQKSELQDLIEAKFDETLPQSFKWIKMGENLTLRDLKYRLNHATAIMLSIKSKNYRVRTAANFEACTAIAYFESHYPKEYYKLIKNELNFAEFMRATPEIINDSTKDVHQTLVTSFNTIFQNTNSTAYSKNFVDELCGLVAAGIFNDDFRMYFYTYPKGSPIKTTEERELCNYLLFPNLHKTHDNLDDIVEQVFKTSKNIIIDNTLKSLEKFPLVVLENTTLFVAAVKVSIEKTFNTFLEEVIINLDRDEKYKANFWSKLSALDSVDYEFFVNKSIEKILSVSKGSNDIIKNRTAIILGLKSNIVDFAKLFDKANSNVPLVTEKEIELINQPDISLKFANTNVLKKDDYKYIVNLINKQRLVEKSESFNIAIDLYRRFSKILTPNEMGLDLLTFLDINEHLDDELFEIISNSEIKHRDIAEYLNKFQADDLSDSYIKNIDNLGFELFLKEEIVDVVINKGLYYTGILYYSSKKKFSKFNLKAINKTVLIDSCHRIIKFNTNPFLMFREHITQCGASKEYEELYFEPFPIITNAEYVSLQISTPTFELIDTTQISDNNFKEVFSMICSRKYSPLEVVGLFNWLFNKNENPNCVSDQFLRKNCLDHFQLNKLELKRLDAQQRNATYNLISDITVINTAEDAINIMQRFCCLIPCIEPLAQKNSEKYSKLIAEIDEFTEETVKWLDSTYLRCGLSEKLCKTLLERADYINFIIADTLRNQELAIKKEIPIENYISVYKDIPEMFDIMSNNKSFLEELQIHADLSELSEKHLVPAFCSPQHERFFSFIFSENQTEEIKRKYLEQINEFASLEDSLAFQRLICQKENMQLLGDYKIYERIHRSLWESNRGHKATFTRKWRECWKEELDKKLIETLD